VSNMADIKGLKIQKRTYNFDIKKRVSLERSYKKVEKSPLDTIKEKIKEFRAPKGKVVLEDSEGTKTGAVDALEEPKEKKKKGSLLNAKLLFRVLGAFVLVFLLLGAAALYFQSMVFASEIVLNPLQSTFLEGDIEAYDILTASLLDEPRQPYHTAFVRLLIEGQTDQAVNVELDAYDSVVPSSVYLLRSHRYQAESYPEFVATLKSNLSNYGIPVNEIGMDELASLPSQSLVL